MIFQCWRKLVVNVLEPSLSFQLEVSLIHSTHILKPDFSLYDGVIFNEAFCLKQDVRILQKRLNKKKPGCQLSLAWQGKSAVKPGSVLDNHLSGMFVAKHLEQPTQLSAGRTNEFLFGLTPDGVYRAATVTRNAVRSYRTFSPLPHLP